LGQTAAETAQKHEQILDESIRLFRERGFAGVSVGQLMKAAGLTHGPFYNHFASKQTLMAECLTRSMQHDISGYARYAATGHGLAQYIGEYLDLRHRNDPGSGCDVAALSAEVRQHEELREPFTVQLKGIIHKLATHFPWRSRRTARGDAIHTYAAMVGAMILARAVDDDKFAKEILDEVKRRTL
jgi:TetR/AcrR family transcriptional regulator, transcriptional repressor for nem operon